MVFPNNNRRHYNVVALVFDKDNIGLHEFSCTCGFCQRWLIPCRHVIAVAQGALTSILRVAGLFG